MEFIVLGRSYNGYGCHRIYTLAGRYLQYRLAQISRKYGSAINEVHIVVCFRHASNEDHGNLQSSCEEHLRLLAKLPRITFRRKVCRLEITYETKVMSAYDAHWHKLSVPRFDSALRDLAEVLVSVRKRLKKDDDFAFDEFVADINDIVSESAVTSEEALQQTEKTVDAYDKAIRDRKGPWEILDIDWDDYHPEARRLLDDPFFWSCSNDHAPHGNDTGADLLADFRKWNRRQGSQSPMVFLKKELKSWDFHAIDWKATDEDAVRQLQKQDELSLSICDEAIIALAFALIKIRGECVPEVREMALAAIRRESLLILIDGCSDKDERESALEMMRMKLEQFSESAPSKSSR